MADKIQSTETRDFEFREKEARSNCMSGVRFLKNKNFYFLKKITHLNA